APLGGGSRRYKAAGRRAGGAAAPGIGVLRSRNGSCAPGMGPALPELGSCPPGIGTRHPPEYYPALPEQGPQNWTPAPAVPGWPARLLRLGTVPQGPKLLIRTSR